MNSVIKSSALVIALYSFSSLGMCMDPPVADQDKDSSAVVYQIPSLKELSRAALYTQWEKQAARGHYSDLSDTIDFSNDHEWMHPTLFSKPYNPPSERPLDLKFLNFMTNVDLSKRTTISLKIPNAMPKESYLKNLNLSGCTDLKDLSMLTYFPNLADLDLSDCVSITNINLLQSCTNLTRLNLALQENAYRYILPDIWKYTLKPLTNLTDLNVENERSVYPKIWTKFSNLLSLRLGETGAQDSDLAMLPKLTTLNINGNAPYISDEGIKNLINLKSLKLGGASVRGFCFSSLPNLTFLDLTEVPHIKNKALTTLSHLTSLTLTRNNEITDEVFPHLSNLTYLDLNENDTITNSAFSSLSNLTYLDISYSAVITDEIFQYLPNLAHLGHKEEGTLITPACITKLKAKGVQIEQ